MHDAVAWIPEVPAYGAVGVAHASRTVRRWNRNPASADRAPPTNGRIVSNRRRRTRPLHRYRGAALRCRSPSVGEQGGISAIRTRRRFAEKVQVKTGGARGASWAGARVDRDEVGIPRKKGASFGIGQFDRRCRCAGSGFTCPGPTRPTITGFGFRIATDVTNACVMADAMFGPVERNPIIAMPDELAMETPLLTAPLHRYVSLFGGSSGATLFSDGLAEYEAGDDGRRVAVTLLRSVGELSRSDIPERPGHAGVGPRRHRMRSATAPLARGSRLCRDGASSGETIDQIERSADDILWLTGATLRSALSISNRSTAWNSPARDSHFPARKIRKTVSGWCRGFVNLLDEPRNGSWRFGAAIKEAHIARLDETISGTCARGRRDGELPRRTARGSDSSGSLSCYALGAGFMKPVALSI